MQMFQRLILIIVAMVLLVPAGMLNSGSVRSQQTDSHTLQYEYTFSLPHFSDVQWFNDTYTRIMISDLSSSGSTGKPRLPVKPIQFLLPEDRIVSHITVETSPVLSFQLQSDHGIELGGTTYSFSRPDMVSFSFDPDFNTDISFPAASFEYLGIQYYHGFPIVQLNLYPVQYIGRFQTVHFTSSMRVIIETTPQTPSFSQQGTEIEYQNNRMSSVKDVIDNPSLMESYTIKHSPSFAQINTEYQYVIITTEALLQSQGEYTFQDLLTYRQSQGLSCTVKTVESIQQEYTGVDLAEKIRNYIRYTYLHHNTSWVLLGGDIGQVPVRMLVSVDGTEPDEQSVASDVYYQCLDGTYDHNGNGLYGERYDGVSGGLIDLYPEVFIGRAPVDDADDVSAFVEKTLAYELSNWEYDSYLKRHLSAGERLWNGPGGYGAGYVERCIDFCNEYNHQTYGIPSNRYTVIPLYERDRTWSYLDAMDEINTGVSIINHVGHGTEIAAMKLSIHDILNLQNTNRYGLFYSQACHAGKLQQVDECLAERWVNAPMVGGFAAIMNTGYGYGSLIDFDGAGNRYAREFFDALFSHHEKLSRLGDAHADSKVDNIWRINEATMIHTFYTNMLFGDPYIQIKGAEDTQAAFTWDRPYPKPGQSIQFTDRSEGFINYREWDFGDGTKSTHQHPVHSFTSEGTYTVTLKVYDTKGYQSTISHKITVKQFWPPVAEASPTVYSGPQRTIVFSANNSWDPDGVIISYNWNFDDGTTSTEKHVVHTFPSTGVYHVRLSVTDNDNLMNTTFCSITIQDNYSPLTPVQPTGLTDVVMFKDYSYTTMSTDPEGDDLRYGWDFGNDEIIWTDWYPSGQTSEVLYQWSSVGQKTVKVKAQDVHGAESDWSEPLMVIVRGDTTPPAITLIAPTGGFYINNRHLFSVDEKIWALGPLEFSVNVTSLNGVHRVVFLIDDVPMAEVLSPPYRWIWSKPQIFRYRHTVTIRAYDSMGNYDQLELPVVKIF